MTEVPKAYVSSESPVKHTAISQAFNQVGLQIETIGFAVESGVEDQPLSIEKTHEGAQNRHAELRRLVGKKAGYLVTIESGMVKSFPGDCWRGCEVVIVEKQPDGVCKVGVDLGIEVPQEMMDKIPSLYPDLGVLMRVEHGYTEKDPPSYLTNGKLPRSKFIEQALVKVLATMEANI